MPQPLSRVRPDAEITVSPGALHKHPIFAARAMRVIAIWAHIDGDFTGILANLLRTDILAGAAMYQALSGGEAKRQVLMAAAKASQPEWQVLLLQAILKVIRASREQRNYFAHHVWGVTDQIPEAMLLMPPSVLTARNISMRYRVEELPGGRGIVAPKGFDYSQIMVYRSKDFEQALDEAGNASTLVSLLYASIGETRSEVARRQLLNNSRVQQTLQMLTRESSPYVQAQLLPPGDRPPAPGIWEEWDKALGRNRNND